MVSKRVININRPYFLDLWVILSVFIVLLLTSGTISSAAQGERLLVTKNSQLPNYVEPEKLGVFSEGTSTDWWAVVQKNIQNAEYHITWQEKIFLEDVDSAWQAPNRAQNLRIYFMPEGFRVVPRISEKPEWLLGLSLRRYGKLGAENSVAGTSVTVSGNRVEYPRQGMTEWYINDHKGL